MLRSIGWVGIRQIHPTQVGKVKDGVAEDNVCEISRYVELSTGKVRIDQQGSFQVSTLEFAIGQIGTGKVSRFQLRLVEISTRKVGSRQVRSVRLPH